MPAEDKKVLGANGFRKATTDQCKGELAPGYSVKKGELVAFMNADMAYSLTSASTTPATITFNGTTNAVTWTGHGLVVGDAIHITGGSPPAEIAAVASKIFYVQAVTDANTIVITTTVGGGALDFTGNGTGTTTGEKIVSGRAPYQGLLIGASTVDTALHASFKTDFRLNLMGAAAFDKTASDPDRAITVHTKPVIELLTDDAAWLPVGAGVKLKDASTKFENPFKWTLATYGTDELAIVVEQAPLRYPDYGYAAAVKAGTIYGLSSPGAPVKVLAQLRTRFA